MCRRAADIAPVYCIRYSAGEVDEERKDTQRFRRCKREFNY